VAWLARPLPGGVLGEGYVPACFPGLAGRCRRALRPSRSSPPLVLGLLRWRAGKRHPCQASVPSCGFSFRLRNETATLPSTGGSHIPRSWNARLLRLGAKTLQSNDRPKRASAVPGACGSSSSSFSFADPQAGGFPAFTAGLGVSRCSAGLAILFALQRWRRCSRAGASLAQGRQLPKSS